MKRILLATSVLFSAAAFSQFTQSNEPLIGATRTYNRMDDAAPEYASNTGTSAVWDYSTTAGQAAGSTRDLNVVDATATAHASDFPSSTTAYDLGGYITTYLTSSASGKNSQGFFYDDGTTQITAKYTTDDEELMTYPLAMGSSGTDVFAGTISALSQNLSASGTCYFVFDGTGTLKLNAATTLTNVWRYKMVDSVGATTPFGPGYMKRTQYEYYDPTDTEYLPIFIWSRVEVGIAGTPTVTMSVLNLATPDSYLSVAENTLPGVSIYPNPAKDQLFVAGMQNDGSLTIVDLAGKVVKTANAAAGTSSVSVADLKSGVYMVTVSTAQGAKTERIVVQ